MYGAWRRSNNEFFPLDLLLIPAPRHFFTSWFCFLTELHQNQIIFYSGHSVNIFKIDLARYWSCWFSFNLNITWMQIQENLIHDNQTSHTLSKFSILTHWWNPIFIMLLLNLFEDYKVTLTHRNYVKTMPCIHALLLHEKNLL